MARTRHLVALVCLIVSCLFVLVAIGVGRPLPAVLTGLAAVGACLAFALMTRPGPGDGAG